MGLFKDWDKKSMSAQEQTRRDAQRKLRELGEDHPDYRRVEAQIDRHWVNQTGFHANVGSHNSDEELRGEDPDLIG